MTKQEKQLLIKDLCGRLPYNVNGVSNEGIQSPLLVRGEAEWDILTSINYRLVKHGWRPYLRQMEDMTEKENRHIQNRFCYQWDGESVMELINYCKIDISDITDFINWLYEHHFDFNFLIEKGLALEAPKDMYEIK